MSVRPPRRVLLLTLVLFVMVALFRQPLDAHAARLIPPVTAVGALVKEVSGAWSGTEIFPVSRRVVLLAAIAEEDWPEPSHVWPEQPSYALGDDLYAVGPDLTGGMMLYSRPGAAGRSAWLASPGPDGVWASGAADPQEAAAAIDQLARRAEDGTLLSIRAGATEMQRWSYNMRWGDDHIVLFQVMLAARGRHDVIAERLETFPDQMPRIEQLQLPTVWSDQAESATTLLSAVAQPPLS